MQGSAIGLGASVISCCDIVVAWADAKIADPHVVLGLVAEMADHGMVAVCRGHARAKRYHDRGRDHWPGSARDGHGE
ncbi:MAG: hypothetical protein IPI83_14620 [Sphingomonadales bacterium]|nr:hypothetical protein [Sphingomonadales bacterium]